MATHCPVCNFFNPYGAEICGECGHELIPPESRAQGEGRKVKRDQKKSPSDIKWNSIGLMRANGRNTLFTVMLTLSIFFYGLIMLLLSIVKWFKPALGLGFVLLPGHLYPLLAGILFGALTMLISYGFYQQQSWISTGYMVWILLQAFILFILRDGWWRPGWLSVKRQTMVILIILIEFLLLPYIMRLKRHLHSRGR